METMHVPDGEEQKRIPSSSSHQAPVLWPWLLVIVAWTVALVANTFKIRPKGGENTQEAHFLAY